MTRLIHVKIDRLIFVILSICQAVPREIPGFRLVRDTFVRAQTSTNTYRRVRHFVNLQTHAQVFIQYKPRLPKLPSLKITLITDDQQNLTRQEILRIIGQFSEYRLLLLEIAIDFQPQFGINLAAVRQRALFGKSRPKISRHAGTVLYGTRKASKYARCYWKNELRLFRIELELHSEWLRRYDIRTLEDLSKLPNLLCPSHVRFAEIDWTALHKYLLRRGSDADEIIRRAKAQADSIHGAMRFLRTTAQVPNCHRFLVTMAPTDLILRALKTWAQRF